MARVPKYSDYKRVEEVFLLESFLEDSRLYEKHMGKAFLAALATKPDTGLELRAYVILGHGRQSEQCHATVQQILDQSSLRKIRSVTTTSGCLLSWLYCSLMSLMNR